MYPLEAQIDRGDEGGRESTPNEEVIQTKDPEEGSTQKTVRLKRQSTVQAQERIASWMEDWALTEDWELNY